MPTCRGLRSCVRLANAVGGDVAVGELRRFVELSHVEPNRPTLSVTMHNPRSANEVSPRELPPWLRRVRSLRWVIAALLIGLAIHLLTLDPAPLRALAHVPPRTLVLIALLIILNQWLMSWRFKLVMNQCAGADLSHLQWFRLTSTGQFLNLFVPQLGHVHRALILKREHALTYSAYVSGLVVFFWFELLASLLLAVFVIAVYDPGFRLGLVPVLPILGAAFAMLLAFPVLLGSVVGRMHLRWPWAERMLARAHSSLVMARATLASSSFVLKFFALNVAVAAGHIAVLALAFDAVGGPLRMERLMLFQVLLKLSNQVVITPGNLGLTELAYGVLAEASASGVQHGIAVALLVRTLGTVVIVALGVALGGIPVLTEGRRGRSLFTGKGK